jgi:sugar phosphate isomerase/epimerase
MRFTNRPQFGPSRLGEDHHGDFAKSINAPMSRREFAKGSLAAAAMVAAGAYPAALEAHAQPLRPGDSMGFGLVTYLWGQHWSLDELLSNCEATGVLGVELRTTHRHGVEPSLSDEERKEVARRFADTPVTLVGLGSNERYDDPDPAKLRKAIETTKDFIRLSHDVGSTGVKVKPDTFHPGIPREKTIEQIGRALNFLGAYAEGFGQQVRLEVHGQCAELPTIKAIMDIADHPSVAVCWNSNRQDLEGEGLEHNFRLVADRFGATLHVRELDTPDYPFAKLIELLVGIDYDGWVLLEASSKPDDPLAALIAQRKLFEQFRQQAQAGA